MTREGDDSPTSATNSTQEQTRSGAANAPRRFVRMAESATSSKGSVYQGAMEAVMAIPIAIGLGYWADDYFETSPAYLIVGAVIGFSSFVLRLMKMRKLVDPPEDDADPSDDG